MKHRLQAQDAAALKRILERARALEKEFPSTGLGLPPTEVFERGLSELLILIQSLSFSHDPQVERLAELADHLHPAMTSRHFLNFLLPLERALDRNLPDEDILITTDDRPAMQARPARPLILVLDNLRSAFNVGSIFRMAETLRAESIYLCGYSPGPDSEGVQKTAMGTERLTSSRHFERVDLALAFLRERGIPTCALETSPQSLSLYEGVLPQACAMVVGNERFGLDFHTLKLCDEIRHIPLAGTKNSLNVASAMAIAAFEWHRQNPVLRGS